MPSHSKKPQSDEDLSSKTDQTDHSNSHSDNTDQSADSGKCVKCCCEPVRALLYSNAPTVATSGVQVGTWIPITSSTFPQFGSIGFRPTVYGSGFALSYGQPALQSCYGPYVVPDKKHIPLCPRWVSGTVTVSFASVSGATETYDESTHVEVALLIDGSPNPVTFKQPLPLISEGSDNTFNVFSVTLPFLVYLRPGQVIVPAYRVATSAGQVASPASFVSSFAVFASAGDDECLAGEIVKPRECKYERKPKKH